jgi:hypothetical protein
MFSLIRFAEPSSEDPLVDFEADELSLLSFLMDLLLLKELLLFFSGCSMLTCSKGL